MVQVRVFLFPALGQGLKQALIDPFDIAVIAEAHPEQAVGHGSGIHQQGNLFVVGIQISEIRDKVHVETLGEVIIEAVLIVDGRAQAPAAAGVGDVRLIRRFRHAGGRAENHYAAQQESNQFFHGFNSLRVVFLFGHAPLQSAHVLNGLFFQRGEAALFTS